MSTNDDELRARFAELRREDARRAPDFGAMRAAPRPVRSPLRWALPVVAVAAAAAIVVVRCGASELTASAPASAPAAASAPELDPAPLDFLLETPGSDALARTPDLFDSTTIGKW